MTADRKASVRSAIGVALVVILASTVLGGPSAHAGQPVAYTFAGSGVSCFGSHDDYGVSLSITFDDAGQGWVQADLSPTLFAYADIGALDAWSNSTIWGTIPVRSYEEDGVSAVGALAIDVSGGPAGDVVSGVDRYGSNYPPHHGNLRYRTTWERQPLELSGTAAWDDVVVDLRCSGTFEKYTAWSSQPEATVVVDTSMTLWVTCILGDDPASAPIFLLRRSFALLLMPDGASFYSEPDWSTPRHVEGSFPEADPATGEETQLSGYWADLRVLRGWPTGGYDPEGGYRDGFRYITYDVVGSIEVPGVGPFDLSGCRAREFGPSHAIWTPQGATG